MLRRAATAILTTLALVGLSDAPAAQAHTLSVRDEGRLRFVGAQARALIDTGSLTGTLPGRARVRFVYDGRPNVSATFTIATARGSISGSAHARLNNPSSSTPSFRGALRITSGRGRYSHARGSGELFGVFHRHGYGLVFQAIGRLDY
jgi:hypothetical protein